jgi:predicted dehydrogenase
MYDNVQRIQPILNWGLLGTARINRALIKPLKNSRQNKLLGVASRTIQRAKEYASHWDIPCAYGSYEEMLADPKIDVVYISLPNGLHREWSIKCAQAGKHILCEKSIALSVTDVDEMANAADQAGVFIAEAFMYRHHPLTLKVKEMIDQGEIGDIRLIRGCFTFQIQSETDIRLNPELGGGCLWDIGCYPISYAHFLLSQEPIEVFGWQYLGKSGVDETFIGQLHFSNSAYVQFDASFRCPYRASMEIIGSQASFQIPNPFKPGLSEKIIIVRDKHQEIIEIEGEELYLGEVEDLAQAIFSKQPPRISMQESRGNIGTISALLTSAIQGKPVPIME